MSINTLNLDAKKDYIISTKLNYFKDLAENTQIIILTLFANNCEEIRQTYFAHNESVFLNQNEITAGKLYNVIITTPIFFNQNYDRFVIQASHVIIHEPHLVDTCGYTSILQSLKPRLISHSLDLKVEKFLSDPVLVTANKKYFIRCKDEQIFYILYAIFKFNLLKGKVCVKVCDKLKKKYEFFMKVVCGEVQEEGSNIIVIGDVKVDEVCDRIIYLTDDKEDAEEYIFDDSRVEKEKYRLRDLYNAISKGVCAGKKEFDFERFKSLRINK
ncbi:ATP-dependent DNA/RNA helicase [Conglomerata obtusa]